MFSVNQMNIYHVLMEAFNVINFGSSEKIQEKWLNKNETLYSNRRQNNVQIPRVKHAKGSHGMQQSYGTSYQRVSSQFKNQAHSKTK